MLVTNPTVLNSLPVAKYKIVTTFFKAGPVHQLVVL